MCGLIGVASSHVTKRHKDVFKTLTLLNSLRGVHGCGFLMLFEDGGKKRNKFYRIVRSELPSSSFCYKKEFSSFMDENFTKVLMGHSRHATMGAVSEDNCHPFLSENKNVIGFHNGTVRGNFDGSSKYQTDSEGIVNLIATKGLKEALDDIHENSWGGGMNTAYALQIFDRESGNVYLIRNNERPLWICEVDQATFWSSEKIMLQFALSREGYKSEDCKYRELKPGERIRIQAWETRVKTRYAHDWYTPPKRKSFGGSGANWRGFNPGNYGGAWESEYYNGHRDPYRNNWNGVWGNKKTDDHKDKKEEDKLPKPVLYVGKAQISTARLNSLLQTGCAVCGNPYFWTNNTIKLPVKMTPNIEEVICTGCEDIAEKDYGVNKSSLLNIERVIVQ